MKTIKVDVGAFEYYLNFLTVEDYFYGRKKAVEIQWIVGTETVNVAIEYGTLE